MRKLLSIVCVLLGPITGMLVGLRHGNLAVGILLGFLWITPGIVLSSFFWKGKSKGKPAAKVRGGRRAARGPKDDEDEIRHAEEIEQINRLAMQGSGTTPEELAENYWRDKGHPPFMNPERYEEDSVKPEDFHVVNPDDCDLTNPWNSDQKL